jgi:predicted ribosomally synthesized peptide with nif11-like leader
MKEEIKLLLQKFADDTELQEKMSKCKSPEEAYAIASSVQEGFTFEEFVDEMTKLNNMLNGELSDEDLAKVAGGNLSSGEARKLSIGVTVSTSVITAGMVVAAFT